MRHSRDSFDDLEPPPDARCMLCGSGERLRPILSVSVSPGRSEKSIAGWMCAACRREQVLRQMEQEAATYTRYVESHRESPLHRWDAERTARHCAASHRRTLAQLGEAPSPAVAEFITRHDPDGGGDAEFAAMFARGPSRPPHAPISEAELLAAYRLLSDDEEDARQLAQDELRVRRARPDHDAYDPMLFMAVATLSPEAEARMRAHLREHYEWTDERFDETLGWARRVVFGQRDL